MFYIQLPAFLTEGRSFFLLLAELIHDDDAIDQEDILLQEFEDEPEIDEWVTSNEALLLKNEHLPILESDKIASKTMSHRKRKKKKQLSAQRDHYRLQKLFPRREGAVYEYVVAACQVRCTYP